MKKLTSIKIVLFCYSMILSSILFSQDNKVWVSFDDKTILPKKTGDKLKSSSPTFQSIINQFGITSVNQILSASKNPDLLKVYEITCNCNNVELLQNLTRKIEGISNPELAPVYETLYDPNDYNAVFAVDYALDKIRAKSAWNITMGDSNLTVAVSDANFDANHVEFQGKIDYLQPGLSDPNLFHGTAVAISIAGNTDNNFGKSSVAGGCRLKLYGMNYNALLQACYSGARVINASWAASCSFSNYGQMVCDEIYNNGVMLIAAAGNGTTCGGAENLVYPASYNHVISVTAIGVNDNHVRTQTPNTYQHNLKVDIAAPGYEVAVLGVGSNYSISNGTSFSSPIVSGVAALILSVNPCLTVDQVEQVLKESSVNIDSLNPNYIGLIGAGRVDARAALEMAQQINTLTINHNIESICERQAGSISITSPNGIAPYTYLWSDNSTNAVLQNIPYGTYTVELTDSRGCKGVDTITLTGTTINYDYLDDVVINSPNFQFNDLNNDGIVKIQGAIIIDENTNYSIDQKKIQFGYKHDDDFSGIIIKKNANLSINHHSILKGLTACNSQWDGIIIKDNYNGQSFIGNGGKLNLNNSSIYDTKNAIVTESSTQDVVNNQFGTFEVKYGLFYDNQNGFIVRSNANANTENLVDESMFYINDDSIINPIHFTLNDVNNLKILRSSFFGNSNRATEERGTAIKATNSTIYVTGDTTTVINTEIKKADFYDLNNGIQTFTTNNIVKPIFISNCNFSKVNQAINLKGNNNGVIYKNEFFQLSGTETIPSTSIAVYENNQLVISENNFKTAYKEQQGVFGIQLFNLLNNNIQIYKNQYDGNFRAGNYFDGENLNVDLNCNRHTGSSDYDWYINSGKLKNQGGFDDNGNQTCVFNYFSDCNSKVSQVFVKNTAENFIYSSTNELMPKCFSLGLNPVVILTKNATNVCETFFKSEEIVQDVDETVVDGKIVESVNISASVYPNPTVNNFNVSWTGQEVNRIIIYNSLGKIITDKEVSGTSGTYSFSNLNNGAFFVKLVQDKTTVYTEKLIINF